MKLTAGTYDSLQPHYRQRILYFALRLNSSMADEYEEVSLIPQHPIISGFGFSRTTPNMRAEVHDC